MPARLENWWWSAMDGDGYASLRGEVYDDPPPRSYPDGDHVTTREVEEEERRGAAEGTTVSTASGRRYLLGVPATHDTLADQRDAAQRKVSELQEKLAAIERAANPKKRPRGRAPDGFSWDKQKCGWFDENGEQFEKVDHPARKKARVEYAERDRTRLARRAIRPARARSACFVSVSRWPLCAQVEPRRQALPRRISQEE